MDFIQNLVGKYKQNGLTGFLMQIGSSVHWRLCSFLGKVFFSKRKLKNVIVIESHNDFDCNGGAFYQFLIDKSLNKKYKIVWLLKNKKPQYLPENVLCFDYFRASIRKEYYLSIAKYLLNDDKYIEKHNKNQIAVYCTHGGASFKNVIGHIVVPDYIDYIISPSERFDPYICRNYSIPYPNERMIHCGYPANDNLFCNNKNECKKILAGVFSKYILWMPTFRQNSNTRIDSDDVLPMGIPLIKSVDQQKKLNGFLADHDCLLIIKIHPFQLKGTYSLLRDMSNIVILDSDRVKELNIDNYRLMGSCDALISDFSSSAYSYILLDRPIAFDMSDLQHYKPGLIVENINDALPGVQLFNLDDFMHFIETVTKNDDVNRDRRNLFKEWMYEFLDGNSCKRLADFLKLYD